MLDDAATKKNRNMKTTIKIEKEVTIKKIAVKAGVRYWEDAKVDGVEDVDGNLIPCRKDEYWCPVIDIDSGIILNWRKGVTADIHYKVCDDGSYYLKDEEGEDILCIENDYVPKIMSPEENGYGDYIIMKVLANGQIVNWQIDIEDFIPEQ